MREQEQGNGVRAGREIQKKKAYTQLSFIFGNYGANSLVVLGMLLLGIGDAVVI